ncbi:MAG: hypothetical protein ACAH59_05885 [Pseudobdellovibrionaceae bacterium]
MKLTLVILCWGQFALAAGSSSKLSVRQLVDHFYQQKERQSLLLNLNELHHPPHCDEPVGPSCTDVACEKLGAWGCDDLSEIKEVGAACRGNYDGQCLKAACAKLGAWGCDNLSEVKEVARACVGNYEMSCFDSVCQRLGAWGCDDLSEVKEVLQTCSGN